MLLVLSRVSKARLSQPGQDVTFIVTLNLSTSRDSLSSCNLVGQVGIDADSSYACSSTFFNSANNTMKVSYQQFNTSKCFRLLYWMII